MDSGCGPNKVVERTTPVQRSLRYLAEQAFSRAAGAPLIPGNSIRLLRDATENYPTWLEAIRSAERWIHFENYIIANDSTGREFIEALAAKARGGVRVRVVYDWMGTKRYSAPRRQWVPASGRTQATIRMSSCGATRYI